MHSILRSAEVALEEAVNLSPGRLRNGYMIGGISEHLRDPKFTLLLHTATAHIPSFLCFEVSHIGRLKY